MTDLQKDQHDSLIRDHKNMLKIFKHAGCLGSRKKPLLTVRTETRNIVSRMLSNSTRRLDRECIALSLQHAKRANAYWQLFTTADVMGCISR